MKSRPPGWGALKHLATPFILVLFVVTWIDATVHDGFFFFAFTYLAKVGVPSNWVQTAMSVGQLAEIGTMAFLAPVLATLGWRKTMVIGILGHAVRFAVFALVPNPYCAGGCECAARRLLRLLLRDAVHLH